MGKAYFTDAASIPSVIAEMTLEEKARMYTGQTAFSTCPIPRLGIPSAAVLDGAPGINYGQLFGEYASQELIEKKINANETAVSGMESMLRTSKLVEMLRKEGEIDESRLDDGLKEVWFAIKKRLDERFPDERMERIFANMDFSRQNDRLDE